MADLLTVGKVAQQLSVPEHRIQYLFRARKIPDVARVGGRRVFTAEDVQRIAEVLGVSYPTAAHQNNKGGSVAPPRKRRAS